MSAPDLFLLRMATPVNTTAATSYARACTACPRKALIARWQSEVRIAPTPVFIPSLCWDHLQHRLREIPPDPFLFPGFLVDGWQYVMEGHGHWLIQLRRTHGSREHLMEHPMQRMLVKAYYLRYGTRADGLIPA